ncbi:Imidazoleglycerol-phosphate dehydratase [Liberibacter crescens BT-1]|uniref:Imidazoleglycerol-phosphate dehydratase n=1 Tax=Liberibacter crescens (strain BT-1) TaxID=1215343 RepID=L0EY77_LIBCB|nr:imidazoleglycerol-phosphate dehydratase HisB [Liberibacter crescens]AGA65341.1 Imidazoleglycerol-phosphate dehydratase [Liberibacter crescens BT-1]AMC12282.1 imidazoleglycerol-phosphate dehydratase [Liberibacter crescens]
MEKKTSCRIAEIVRKTTESTISVYVNLDGRGISQISTSIAFLDHMLRQLSFHSLIDITIEAKGDTDVDYHHTVEDIGIVLGQAISKALGNRKEITRFASIDLVMDETMITSALDISGRPFLIWDVPFSSPKIGTFDTELVQEFFQSFSQNCRITLHLIKKHGANNHHLAETCFKAVARCLYEAIKLDPNQAERIPSTKGIL